MKNRKIILLPIFLVLFGIIGWGFFFWQGECKYDKMVNEFTEKKNNETIKTTT